MDEGYYDNGSVDRFVATCLQSVHAHPWDRTIRCTSRYPRRFYVEWYPQDDDRIGTAECQTRTVSGFLAQMRDRGLLTVPGSNPESDVVDVGAEPGQNRESGLRLHRWLECVLNGMSMQVPLAPRELWQQACAYIKDHVVGTWVPWRTEMPVRTSAEHRLVGVVDALFVRHGSVGTDEESLELMMVDWKYTRSVGAHWPEFVWQLNVYKYILEHFYGGQNFQVQGRDYSRVHIAEMYVVAFHESHAQFRSFPVPEVSVEEPLDRSLEWCPMNVVALEE